jgi:nitrile hydratase accessory protein
MTPSDTDKTPIRPAGVERGRDGPVTLPLQPCDDEGPVFREPWEAQAFAMALALHRRGLFTWKEWADTLAAQIAAAQAAGDPDVGDTYYRHWLAALETIVAAKGASTPRELGQHRLAWERAAHRTPHGQPIVLQPADFRDG